MRPRIPDAKTGWDGLIRARRTAQKCKDKPGHWYPLARYGTTESATAAIYRIRHGKVKSFGDGYSAQLRNKTVVWVCWEDDSAFEQYLPKDGEGLE